MPDEHQIGYSRSKGSLEEWVGDHASRESVWSLLSFFELPTNAAEKIRAQSNDFPWGSKASSLAGRKSPVSLDYYRELVILDAADKVSVCVRHARAYMSAAASSPLTAKPTFLYYGCLALARAVVASVFVREEFTKAHGIRFDREKRLIKVERKGEVADLHDATYTLPDFYDGKTYQLDEVVRVLPGTTAAMKRVTGRDELVREVPDRCQRVPDIGGNDVIAHFVAWEMIGVFALSDFSRYDPLGWEKILRGDPDGRSHAYMVFMEEVEISFPLEVACLLSGTNYTYGPSAKEKADVDKMITDRVGRSFRSLTST